MPLYEYHCDDCDHRFEVLQRLEAGTEELLCPECGGESLEKLFSTFAASAEGSAAVGPAPAGGCGGGAPT